LAKYLTGKIPCKLVAAKQRSRFSGAAGYFSIVLIILSIGLAGQAFSLKGYIIGSKGNASN
jgi:hypothetical protein